MNNIEKYTNTIDNIVPDEELIKNTIDKINKLENKRSKLDLIDILRKFIITVVSLSAVTGCAYAAAKYFDYDFMNFLGIKSEKVEEYGVNVCEIGETVKVGNAEVTLEQFVADTNNIYVLLNMKGINRVSSGFEFYEGKECTIENLLQGNVITETVTGPIELDNKNAAQYENNNEEKAVIQLNGAQDLTNKEYITLRIVLDENKHIDMTFKTNITTISISRDVNYTINLDNGKTAALKNIKMSPLGISFVLNTNNNETNLYNSLNEYIGFSKEIVMNDNSIVKLGGYDNEDTNIISASESIDKTNYIIYNIKFNKVININEIKTLKIANLNINVKDLINNNAENSNKYSEENLKVVTDKTADKKISEFLSQDGILSTSSIVGSGYTDMYSFQKDGKFAWTLGEANPTQKGETISYRGTWEVKDGILVLTLKEKEVIVGGNIVEDDPINGTYIENYTKKTETANNRITYNVSMSKYNGQDFIQLGEFNLYKVGIPEKLAKAIEKLANEGYQAYNQAINEFYQEN